MNECDVAVDRLGECLLSAVNRTLQSRSGMSAFDPKRTSGRAADAGPSSGAVLDILGTPWISSRSVMNRSLGFGREGGIGGRSAQQVQRHFDRFIVGFVRRHVGLRAGLLGTLGFEVAAQRGSPLVSVCAFMLSGTSCSTSMSGVMPVA